MRLPTRALAWPSCWRAKLKRDARRGLWHSWAYRVEDAEDAKRLGRLTHSYQLVEGTMVTVGEGQKWIYLNFAEDWRADFTISVDRKKADAFEAAGLDLHALAGKNLRVRGWVEWRNGPMIEATYPEQIELLAPAPEPAPRPKEVAGQTPGHDQIPDRWIEL
jgi:hypothetical protein